MVVLPNVEVTHAGDKGVRLRFKDGTLHWLPRSQIKDGINLTVGFKGDLQITKWFAGILAEKGPRLRSRRAALIAARRSPLTSKGRKSDAQIIPGDTRPLPGNAATRW